jgi:hypothetical protein
MSDHSQELELCMHVRPHPAADAVRATHAQHTAWEVSIGLRQGITRATMAASHSRCTSFR